MNKRRILITGVSGFIGRHVARELRSAENQITAIIRPDTEPWRIEEFKNIFTFLEVDLADIPNLRRKLNRQEFDVILHLGALRGGRRFGEETFYRTNVSATEQLLRHAKITSASFIFCSSVGVFGAIPAKLPANNRTSKNGDTFYHQTKIKAEELIQAYVKEGLQGIIVRPAITYGVGDYGFPYTLIKMVDKKIFFLPEKPVTIHLTHIDLICRVFKVLCESSFEAGNAYIVADKSPVLLQDLVNFISQQLHGIEYSRYKVISSKLLDMGIWFAKTLKSDLWKSRFELISKSWYYDTKETYEDFKLSPVKTIPEFRIVTDWYKEKN